MPTKRSSLKEPASRKPQPCDPNAVLEFDYTRLGASFSKLSKPAQRALVNNKVFSPADLARRSLDEVLAFHGIGKSSVPMLQEILRVNGLTFRPKKSG